MSVGGTNPFFLRLRQSVAGFYNELQNLLAAADHLRIIQRQLARATQFPRKNCRARQNILATEYPVTPGVTADRIPPRIRSGHAKQQ